jgi:hypothetical protein
MHDLHPLWAIKNVWVWGCHCSDLEWDVTVYSLIDCLHLQGRRLKVLICEWWDIKMQRLDTSTSYTVRIRLHCIQEELKDSEISWNEYPSSFGMISALLMLQDVRMMKSLIQMLQLSDTSFCTAAINLLIAITACKSFRSLFPNLWSSDHFISNVVFLNSCYIFLFFQQALSLNSSTSGLVS